MGLFDIFKKKTTPPQRKKPADFSPLDIYSVIHYIKKKNPNVTEQEIADIIKKMQGKVQITWEETTGTSAKYDPWAKTESPINDNYAIAAFISISERGAKIGRTNDDYARYFNYRYGVYDPVGYHKRVIADGYLVEAAPEVALEKLSVSQLKDILASAGLPANGIKADLVSRIIAGVNIDDLSLEKYYIPSRKGTEHLRKYEYAFSLPSYNISFEEFDRQKEACADYFKPNDIIWQILNDRFNRENTNGSYGPARNELFYMATLLKGEKRYTDALCHYTLVLYYDVNARNGIVSESPEDVTLAPGIVEQIRKLKEHYDPRIISRCYDRHPLPHQYVDRGNFEKLLFDIFEGKKIDMENYITP